MDRGAFLRRTSAVLRQLYHARRDGLRHLFRETSEALCNATRSRRGPSSRMPLNEGMDELETTQRAQARASNCQH